MLDLDRLKQTLVESGKLKPERIAEAETFAREQNVPFTRALTSQLMIGFTDLGACCSAVTGLPYVSLPTESEPPDAARLFSPDCVRAWQMFPLAFDASTHALTIAVHDPDQIPRLERLSEFLMQPHRLAFTIAAESEIERAYSRYYDTESAQTRIAKFVHRDSKTKASLPATPEAPVKPVKSGKTKPAPAAPPNRDEHQPDYAAMSQALIGAATLLVRQQFDAEPDRIHGVRGCVRYCQLLASRLRFTPAQADALVLAAWLSVLGDRPGVIQRLAAPYKLESVLLPGTTGVGRVASHRPEALVLGLVKAHQTLKSQEPDICRDVNLIRHELRSRWSSDPRHQGMLETFLQVLMDEEFLDQLAVSAGRVLVIDPEEVSRCELAPPLMGLGYEVAAMPDVRSAEAMLGEFDPNMIILSVADSGDKALWFCERLKSDAKTAAIPILVVVEAGRDRLAVKALRAGADDYVARPVNTELLYIKVQNYLRITNPEPKECGVSGSLDEMSFTDMIQILCAGRRNVDILLTSEHEEGRVYIRDGNVVHAAAGGRTGEAAFYALMRWREGIFTTRQSGDLPEASIHVSAMSLLMEGARQVDEASEASETAGAVSAG